MQAASTVPEPERDVALPVRVAAVNDYELVVAGVASLLSGYPDKVRVCERIVIGESLRGPVDVALYDTYGRNGIAEPALRALAEDPAVGAVAVFSLDLRPDLIADGRAAGARGFISKALPGSAIADAIVAVARGRLVVAAAGSIRHVADGLDWPGRQDGLSERESQVLVLAAEGLTNREIGTALYLSPETIKGYLRQVFRKLGVHNRVAAANYVTRSGAFRCYQPAAPANGESEFDLPVEGPVPSGRV